MGRVPDDGKVLLGFMEAGEAMDYLRTFFHVDGDEDWERRWQLAQTAARKVAFPYLQLEARAFPDEMSSKEQAISESSEFKRISAEHDAALRLVELEGLVAYQPSVNLSHANRLSETAGLTNLEALIDLCLPLSPKDRKLSVEASSSNAYTVFADGSDHRVYRPIHYKDEGTKRWVFGFEIGWGSPFVQVVRFQDRWILKNGYHRAVAAMFAGAKMIPCVLINGASLAETGVVRGSLHPQVFMGDLPPTIGSFDNDDVTATLPMRRFKKVIRITSDEFVVA